jgi:hypothetical protein
MMRHALLTCHEIFPSPNYVLFHWFAVSGNGMKWDEEDGKLKHHSEFESEIHEPMEFKNEFPENPSMEAFNTSRRLQSKWEQIRWNFVIENIEEIVNSKYTYDFNAGSVCSAPSGPYVTKGISTKYARGLNFPDNINKEWAILLYDFLRYWLVSLNMEYGVSNEKKKEEYRSHWPKDIYDASLEIDKAIERLYVIIYGKTKAEMD